jgi:hypothetical protein
MGMLVGVCPLGAQTTTPAPTTPAAPTRLLTPGGAADPLAEKIKLDFKDTPLADAVKQLSDTLGAKILIDPGIDGKINLQREVPKAAALNLVARQADAMATRCVIFCTAEQLGTADHDIRKKDVKAKLDVPQATTLADVAKQLQASTMIKMRCLPEVAKLSVQVSVGELDLPSLLDFLAKQAGCKWTMGWVVTEVDPNVVLGMLQGFNNLPQDQKDQMFDNGFNQAISTFKNMSPADRQQTIQDVVNGINNFANALQNADPQTRAQFDQAVAPLIQRGLQKFVTLDAPTQSALMPVINALKKLH